ncbi:MAG: AAA family ATPase [Alphaproteobacteria bacterium]|nr:AAA family ATPase [Alphaproteobacteria bacterium]
MTHRIPESELPTELTPFQAVELAYPTELTKAHEALRRRLPVLIECDKELVPYFYKSLRDRLKRDDVRCVYLDGRPPPDGQGPQGLIPNLLTQIRDAVRSSVEDKVVVLPHLDLLTTSSGGLTTEAREVTGLLYENPNLLWVGFKDPSFAVPRVIENLFPHHECISGVERNRLSKLVTQREARKFGEGLPLYQLYKYVSGTNAVRLRRLLGSVEGEDYPGDANPAYQQLRSGTLSGDLSVPELSLYDDIGGYDKVKDRLQQEILDILAYKETLSTEEEISRVEKLVPRGMIFWGPPGTGKTLFAKAMASTLGAAVIIVSGPELKSKWHGESEQNIRRVFVQARQSAPAIIVFDELDSIASARGSDTGDGGVGHSMVNQLLTELDGFRSNEMVFVVGTTNFPESLDPALLRPGRFEFKLHIPFPGADDRLAILKIYDAKFGLQMSERGLDYAVKRTAGLVEGSISRYTGDHLEALCRALARRRIREQLSGATEPADIDAALEAFVDRPELTATEERVVATHEAGHAVVALHCTNLPPIDRISIRGDLGGALGYVSYGDSRNQYVQTRGELLDRIAVLFGGRESEDLLLEDLSFGSAHDLEQATGIARWLVEQLAMGPDHSLGVRMYETDRRNVSEAALGRLEEEVQQMLAEQRTRCRTILEENLEMVKGLTELLLEKKVLDRAAFAHLVK